MALFSRREKTEQVSAQRATTTAPAPPARQELVNRGWEEGDPRHTGHMLLSQVGLANVWWWDKPVEELWQTLVGRAPGLRALKLAGRSGFAQLQEDDHVFAFGVDGPRGSAVVLASLPDADFDQLFKNIVLPLDGIDERGVTLSLATQGEVESGAAQVLETGDIVQLTELPLRGSGEPMTYTVLPPWTRRNLSTWTQVTHDLYRRDFIDSAGDEVLVWCGLDGGKPSLIYPFFDMPSSDLSPLEPMREHIAGDIIWMDPKAAARRTLSHESAPEAESQELVDSVARGLSVLSQHIRGTSSGSGEAEQPAGSVTVPTTLSSWTDVLTVLRTRFKVAREFSDDENDPSVVTGCKLIFDVGDDRTQAVYAASVHLGNDPWVRISSPFARLETVDLREVLQGASETVCGDVRLMDDLVTFNHTAPVKGLGSEAFTDLVRLIVSSADQLEREFGTGDDFF